MITFAEHKEKTAQDCEAVATILTELAADVREGNMNAFEQFWLSGGTEEGDPKIAMIREMLLLRYVYREEEMEGK